MINLNYIESNFSDELKLIILLSQNNIILSHETNFENINWELFIQLLRKHRLVSHIIKNKYTEECLPGTIYERIKHINVNQSKKTLLFTGELFKIHEILNANNISHIFFKGSLLSLELYNDIGFRNFKDIDLLVSKKDVEKAVKLITDLNYSIIEPKIKLSEKQKKVNYSISHHYHLRHNINPIEVELHWNLTNPKSYFSVPTNELINNKRNLDFQNQVLPYISSSENIVFLAAHGAIHQWYRLFWLKDFSELLLKTSSEEINNAWELAKKLKLKKCLTQACILSQLIYKTDLPAFIKSKKINHKLIQVPLKSIATTELKQQGGFGKFKYVFYRLSLKPTIIYYFDLIYRLRTHFSDWEIIKLPDNLFFLHYLLRPFLLIYKSFKK